MATADLRAIVLQLSKKYQWSSLSKPMVSAAQATSSSSSSSTSSSPSSSSSRSRSRSRSLNEFDDSDDLVADLSRSFGGTLTMNDDDDDDDDDSDDLFFRTKKPTTTTKKKQKGTAVATSGGSRPSIDDTLMFKPNTKSKKLLEERDAVTAKLYRRYNEAAFGGQLPLDLPIVWSKRLTSTAGLTKMSFQSGTGKKQGEIILSAKVVDDVLRLKTTLLHEMCHAAAWFIDNTRKPPHGASFWKWASISSASTGLTVTTCHSYVIHKPYVFQCVNATCQTKYGRHSKSIDTSKHCCGVCRGKLEYVGTFNADGTPKRAGR